MELLSFNLTFVLYLTSLIFYSLYFFYKKIFLSHIALFSLIAGFIFHVISLAIRMRMTQIVPITNLYESISFLAFSIVLVFLIIELKYRLHILGTFIIPMMFIFIFFAFTASKEIPEAKTVLRSIWFNLHVPFSFLSYASFSLAFGIGIVYLIQEKQLKSHHIGKVYYKLPSLEILDSLNYKLLGWGIVLLTIGIVTGSMWERDAFGYYWQWTPKEVWAFITWLIYISSLHLRFLRGWRGRRTAYFSIFGFISMMITFLGVEILSKGFHGFL